MFQWIDPDDEIPAPGCYVLIWVPEMPWHDSSDPSGVFFDVAKLRMRDPSQPSGNHQRPYEWNTFGHEMYFGQDVKRWAYIPEVN